MANLVTIARILLIVPFTAVFLAGGAWSMNAALAIYVIAALTDFVDGRLARARGEVTALGAALDPIADKLLIAAAMVLLVRNGVIHSAGVVAVLVILLREILISGLREAMVKAGASLPVTPLAKWKTTLQLAAGGFMLAAAPGGLVGDELRPIASALLWMAALLTFWTGADYARKAAQALGGARPRAEA